MRLLTLGKGNFEVLYPLGDDEICFKVKSLEDAFVLYDLFEATLQYNETGVYKPLSSCEAKVYTGYEGKVYAYPVAYHYQPDNYYLPFKIGSTWVALWFDNREIARDWACILKELGYDIYQS